MTRKRHGLCAADMRMQLETIINSVSQKVSSAGPLTWSVVMLTTEEELNWLAKWAQDERVQTAVAGLVFCLDYLAARKVCPEQEDFFNNDLIGLLSGTASTAQVAQAVAAAVTDYGYQTSFIPNLIPKVVTLQEQLHLPPLVLPISVMVLGTEHLEADRGSGYCYIHWGQYQENNLDLSQARLWWRKGINGQQFGRAARYLALNQLRRALAGFGLTVAGIPIDVGTGTTLPRENMGVALKKVAQRFPRSFFSWQKLRLAWIRLGLQVGRISQAECLLQRVQASESESPDVLLTAGILLWFKGQLQPALEAITRAERYAPEEGLVYYLKGEIYREMGLLEQSQQSLRRSLEHHREDIGAWLALAKVVEEGRGPKEALAVFEEARATVTPNAALFNKEGLCYSELGQDDKALACYQQALALRPNDPSILANQGLILGRQGKIEAALTCYDQALRVSPNDAYLLNNKGFCLGKLERYAEALRCYEKAIVGQEQVDIGLLHNKATCLSKLGRYKEALLYYDQVLQHNPTDTTTLNNRGLCLLNLGRIRAALECYTAAIQLEPNNGVLWGNKGACLFKQGQYEQALEAYERALLLLPNELAYYSGKGMCLDYLGRAEEAVACYNRALRLA